jgi:hypothetical protein
VCKFPGSINKLITLTGEPERVQKDMFLIGEGLNDSVEKLIRHVVLVHLLCPEEVLVVHDQQTRYLLQHLMRQVVPPVLLQVPLGKLIKKYLNDGEYVYPLGVQEVGFGELLGEEEAVVEQFEELVLAHGDGFDVLARGERGDSVLVLLDQLGEFRQLGEDLFQLGRKLFHHLVLAAHILLNGIVYSGRGWGVGLFTVILRLAHFFFISLSCPAHL